MEDNNEKKPEVYEREKLYEEVWAEPVKIVAQRYGVSDVALAKTCRKLAIPLPGRGYWARLRSGQKMKRAPLPKLPAGVPETLPVYHASPPPTEREAIPETGARMEKESEAEAAIVVAETLEREERGGGGPYSGRSSAPLTVSPRAWSGRTAMTIRSSAK